MATLIYVLLMAIPFMPGIEVGLLLMLMLGQGCFAGLPVYSDSAIDKLYDRKEYFPQPGVPVFQLAPLL